MGLLENLQDRVAVQTRLNQSDRTVLANAQDSDLINKIEKALPDNEEDVEADSVAPEALQADAGVGEAASSSRGPASVTAQIADMLEEEAQQRKLKRRRIKVPMMAKVQETAK